ncbi:MAG TPA: hypothetical protein VGM37_14760 [Armatimonadota bacterium]|jgi:hypothetical protein
MKKTILNASLILAGLAALSNIGVYAQETTPSPAPPTTTAAPKAKTISLDFKDMPIREAVQALFSGTGLNYAVTPEAAQAAPTVTLNLQDVSFDAALNILTKTAGLRYRKDRDTGVYMIEAKTVDTGVTPVGGTTAPDTSAPAPDVTPVLQIEKIPLNYADTIDIYGTLYGQGSNRAANSMNGGSGGFGSSSGGFGSSGGGFGNSSFGGGFGSSGSSFGSSGSSFGNSSFGGGGGFGNSSFGGGGGGFGGFGR